MVSDVYQFQWVNSVNPTIRVVFGQASVKACGGFWPMFDHLRSTCRMPRSSEWEPQIVDEGSPYFVSNTDVKA